MSNATHGGKGDRQRKVNAEKYSSNFDAIFKTEEKKDVKKNDKRPKRDSPVATERAKDWVIEQYPAPVAGVRVIRFIVVCAIVYVCAFCFVLLLRGGV